jgi:(3R)-3-hydroxyacyl-CoA dehydrogenase / 3a,7a,12a-trihydroxy-5b-cholest-24-enoyl-CoA hydratase / enoyl-CoA hydratase 2
MFCKLLLFFFLIQDILDVLKPDYVAPLVLYLTHEETLESGSLFEIGGGWIGKLRWQKSSGAIMINEKDGKFTPEDGIKEK